MLVSFLLGVILGFPILIIGIYAFCTYLMTNIEESQRRQLLGLTPVADLMAPEKPNLEGASDLLHMIVEFLCKNYLTHGGDAVFRAAAQAVCDSVVAESVATGGPIVFTELNISFMRTSGASVKIESLSCCERPPTATSEAVTAAGVLAVSGPLIIAVDGRCKLMMPVKTVSTTVTATFSFSRVRLPAAVCIDKPRVSPFIAEQALLMPLPAYSATLTAPPTNLDFDVSVQIGSSFALTDKGLVGRGLRTALTAAFTRNCGNWVDISASMPSIIPLDARRRLPQAAWTALHPVLQELGPRLRTEAPSVPPVPVNTWPDRTTADGVSEEPTKVATEAPAADGTPPGMGFSTIDVPRPSVITYMDKLLGGKKKKGRFRP